MPTRLDRPRRRRPAGHDTFGGSDPRLHAAMHEAMLAALTPEDEAAIAAESARLLLGADWGAGELEALYGAEAVRLALLPRPPRPPRRLTLEEYRALGPGERRRAILEGRVPRVVADRFCWSDEGLRALRLVEGPGAAGDVPHRDELPSAEHEAILAGIDPEVARGLRARSAAMVVAAGLLTPEEADAAYDLRGHPLPELEAHERLRR